MTTYVKMVNLNDETRKKVLDLFSTPENSSYINILENLNKVYGESFAEPEGVSRVWMDDNVKWSFYKMYKTILIKQKILNYEKIYNYRGKNIRRICYLYR